MGSSGNFATLNPLNTRGSSASTQITQNNLQYNGQATQDEVGCTINVGNDGVPKVYFEMYIINNHDTGWVGIYDTHQLTLKREKAYGTSSYRALLVRSTQKVTGSTTSNYIGDGSDNNNRSGQTIGVAIDVPNQKIWFAVNDAWGGDGASDPSDSNYAFNDLSATGSYDVVTHMGGASVAQPDWCFNFGQDSTFQGRETAGGNTDANGFGDFRYAPPSGFVALCTANINVSSNIDSAQTDDDHPVKLCNAVAYTGTGSARTVSGFGFQPDMVWIKNRASPGDQAHRIVDSSRGVSKAMIAEDTQVENTETTAIQAFNSDGFTIGSALGGYNTNTGTYIAWGWKANGGTTSTNTSGTVTTTVQASTAGGFSILTYTGGNGSWGSTNQDTIGHGLSAAPEFMIFKERNATDAWTVFHHSVGAGGGTTAAHNNLRLDTNEALYTNQSYKSFGGVMPTSTVVTIEGNTTNESTSNHIAYCWHGVEGYSKFGAYEGNNNNDGVFVYTGFRPRIIFLKAIDQAGEWVVYDTARNVDNPVDSVINWDVSSAESANDATRAINTLSNGFKIMTSNITINNTNTFVYGAWGDVSFKYNNTHP